jgi:hypothetical protein
MRPRKRRNTRRQPERLAARQGGEKTDITALAAKKGAIASLELDNRHLPAFSKH